MPENIPWSIPINSLHPQWFQVFKDSRVVATSCAFNFLLCQTGILFYLTNKVMRLAEIKHPEHPEQSAWHLIKYALKMLA